MTKRKNLIKKLLTNKYLIPLAIVIVIIGIYVYKNTTSFHDNEKAPPPIIPPEDIQFDETCNLMEIIVDVPSDAFEIVEYKCSEEQEFKNKIPDGQELTVDIFTKEFDAGIDKFREWLKSQGLQESNILRIKYEHKPQ